MGGFILYALGTAAAVRTGITINWTAYLLGQVVVTSIQLMAQYLNEYYDREVDGLLPANRTWFSGGSGILSTGVISPSAVLTAARICAVVALVAGIFSLFISVWMIPIIVFSFLGAWFYSSPPLSLMSSGLGELTTSILSTLLVPLTGFFMQKGFLPGELLLVCLPLALVHIAMLLSFEFPDRAADQSVGKKTLTVRMGLQGAAWLVTALISFAYLFIAAQALFSKFSGQLMGWTVPLAIWQIILFHRVVHFPSRPRYFLLTAGGVSLFVFMTILAMLGFVIS